MGSWMVEVYCSGCVPYGTRARSWCAAVCCDVNESTSMKFHGDARTVIMSTVSESLHSTHRHRAKDTSIVPTGLLSKTKK